MAVLYFAAVDQLAETLVDETRSLYIPGTSAAEDGRCNLTEAM